MTEPAPAPAPEPSQALGGAAPAAAKGRRFDTILIASIAALALAIGLLWQKLAHIQEELARQSQDTAALAVEARTLAREAQETVRDSSGRIAVLETRLSEVALQRSQLEELMQSLSRSRDENLVVDIDSSLRLAQQQAQLTGSVEPLLAALKTADQRLTRAAQPRLTPLQRAIARDVDRIKATTVSDTPGLLVKLDELARSIDDLPLANAVGDDVLLAPAPAGPSAAGGGKAGDKASHWPAWVGDTLGRVRAEARSLVRVSRIDQPEAALVSPEQGFFWRENLKLKLLNARLGLLARQTEASRADLVSAAAAMGKYFDPASRKTQAAAGMLQGIQQQMKTVDLPRLDNTLAALATAAAGR